MAEIVAERITSVAIKTLKGLLHKKTTSKQELFPYRTNMGYAY